jgi:hypothetical protein
MQAMKNVAIVLLAALVVWLSLQVIRLENYRYASSIGMCAQENPKDPLAFHKRDQCLRETQTRTNPLWHLWYGAIDRG